MNATEHVLRLRVAILEDAILMHRRMVRDGFVSPHSPDRDPNEFLWRTIDGPADPVHPDA